MNVFIPALKDKNPFFDEIIKYSKANFIFSNLSGYNNEPIVMLHWPEQLFDWKEPTKEQLNKLKKLFTQWKKNATIIYVVHNLKPHYRNSKLFCQLYKIVKTNSDIMIHMGNYSLNLFKKKYPQKKHFYISHPLYLNSYSQIEKEKARKKLQISSDTLVIVVAGKIRHQEEYKMALKAFKSLKEKNKLLIFTNKSLTYKGKTKLKKIGLEKIITSLFFKRKNVKYFEGFLENDKLSLILSACDIVFVPRIKILNSGNVFLGLTFQKIVVGANVGNLFETLKTFNMPTFNPYNKRSVSKALKLAVSKKDNLMFLEEDLYKYHPKRIAKQWDNLIESLCVE